MRRSGAPCYCSRAQRSCWLVKELRVPSSGFSTMGWPLPDNASRLSMFKVQDLIDMIGLVLVQWGL